MASNSSFQQGFPGVTRVLAGRGGINACKVSLRKGEGTTAPSAPSGAFGYAAKPTSASASRVSAGGGDQGAAASVIQKGLQKRQARENRDARKEGAIRRSLML